MKAHWLFLAVFFLLLAVLNIIVGAYFVSRLHPLSMLYLLIMQLLNIGVAYGLTQILFSLIFPKEDLPQLEELTNRPLVALLYTTCDDLMPELLYRLRNQTYANYDVFILDDSTKRENQMLVDRVAADCDFQVVRRGTRRGYKAGNLNHWLALYGDQYKYFIILDSDSALDDDFIERMLRYAEHPSNADVAIFQSKIRAWNTHSPIPKILDAMAPLHMYQQDRLANRFGYISCWGHNNLCRTEPIKQVGGFDEKFVSEDYATAINLIDRGYQCKLVDVISYEGIPEAIYHYTKRSIRWAQQSLELELYKTGARNVPFVSKLHLFMNTYSFAIWFVFLLGIIMATWGFSSTFGDLAYFVGFIIGGEFLDSPFKWTFLIIALYYLYFTFLRLPLAVKAGVGVRDYLKYLFLVWSLGFVTMIPVIVAQTRVLFGARPSFTITGGLERISSPRLIDIISQMRPTLGFILIIVIGIIRNPLSLGLNFLWMIPLILSPLTTCLLSLSRTNQDKDRTFALRGDTESKRLSS